MSEPRDRRGRRLNPWLVGVFLVATLLALVLAVASQTGGLDAALDDVARHEWSLRPAWLVAALLLATTNLFLMGSVWVRLFRGMGGQMGFAEGIRVWLITNLGRYIPGKVWQLTGLAVYLRQREGAGSIGLLSALVFQIVSLATGAAVAAVVLGTRLGVGLGREGRAIPIAALLVAAGLLMLLHPVVLRSLARRVANWMREDLDPLSLGIADVARAATGLLLAWLVYGLGFWCLLSGVGWEGSAGPVELAGVFAAAYVIGYAALFAPGGLVVREGAIGALLVGLTPMSAAVAAAVAILARLWVTGSELIAVGLASVGGTWGVRRNDERI